MQRVQSKEMVNVYFCFIKEQKSRCKWCGCGYKLRLRKLEHTKSTKERIMQKILGKELSNNNFLTTLEQLLQVQWYTQLLCKFAIIVDIVSNSKR